MILHINHYLERDGQEIGVQVEAEYTPGEAPTYWPSPGRQVSCGADPEMEIREVTHNGKEITPTPEEVVGIMNALWDDIEESEEE